MKRMPLALLFFAQAAAAAGSSVVGSKHDLSAAGPGAIRAEAERQVCVFCHFSHGGGTKLSSRPEKGGAGDRPYASSTARSAAPSPAGSSRVCLSCHDGTIAVGDTRRFRIKMGAGAVGGVIPRTSASNLGTDLRRSHPVSIPVTGSTKIHRPKSPGSLKLDAAAQVQCTSCHDPHSESGGAVEGKFLLETTRSSTLCAECHATDAASSHAKSTAPFGKAQGNETPFSTVGDAGCGACHRSHGADARGRLLARSDTELEDAICLRCHAGAVARTDVARDYAKPYNHRHDAPGAHDASEGPANPRNRLPETSAAAPRHAACVDCHDPHSTTDRTTFAPLASGSLAGTWGIDRSGLAVRPATNQYEICFKCHGDSANQPTLAQTASVATAPVRSAADWNLRRVFSPDAPSNHPVEERRPEADAPSLLAPWSPSSLLYCTDCHASDTGPGAGGSGARGPHGSIYPHLLERSYSTDDGTIESQASYALCYKCHDRTKLLSQASAFRLHRKHVVDAHAPCSACHSAHGVSSRLGTRTNNSHLIDFDLTIVKPVGGAPPYTSSGPRSGSCNLTCHKVRHDTRSY